MKKKKPVDESRRGFLKMIGIGAATAGAAAVSKALPAFPTVKGNAVMPITEDCNGFVEVDNAIKDFKPILADNDELDKGVQRYLRQKETDRIYLYTRTLARRPDMVLVEPALAEVLHDDILAVQKLQSSWQIEAPKPKKKRFSLFKKRPSVKSAALTKSDNVRMPGSVSEQGAEADALIGDQTVSEYDDEYLSDEDYIY